MVRPLQLCFVLASAVLLLAACSGSTASESQAEAPTVTELSELLVTPSTDIPANHVDPPVSFDSSPSVGGDHFAFWINCGFYSEEVLEGAATHSLEHGAVWITYNSELPAAEVEALGALASSNPRLLVSPYDHDELIVASAWGAQQRGFSQADDAGLQAFVSQWVDNSDLVEAGANCAGAAGIPPDQPNVLADGTPIPDEFFQ